MGTDASRAPEEIDTKELAAKFKVPQRKIASMMLSAVKSPRAYGELVATGARPHQVPLWIMRPGGETGLTPEKSGVPEGDPADPPVKSPDTLIEQEEHRSQEEEVLDASEGLSAPLRGYRTPGLPDRIGGSRLARARDGVRAGEDRLDAFGIVRSADGRYLRAAMKPDGLPSFMDVDPDEVEQGLRQEIGTQISEVAVGELNVRAHACGV